MTKDEIMKVLRDQSASKDDKISTVMFAIFNLNDSRWLQEFCMQCANDGDSDIAGLAITGIGHIARMYGGVDLETVVPFLEDIKNKNTTLSGRAEDALEDIQIFMNSK